MCDAIRVGLLTVNEAGKHMGGSEEAVPALYPRYKHSKVQRTCQWVHSRSQPDSFQSGKENIQVRI